MNATEASVPRRSSRRPFEGVAAVELALVAPFLTLLLLGAIDMGQYANVYQVVSNASREGARLAARFGTGSATDVEKAVSNYLEYALPGSDAGNLNAATTVTLMDSAGNTLNGGQLADISTGDTVSVTVTLKYQAVRFIRGLNLLGGKDIQTVTIMRRE